MLGFARGAVGKDLASAPQKIQDFLSALPQKFQDAPTQVREAYQFALANQDILKYIPCYCGCGKEGHKSVKDCFVQEVRAGGTVIWDEMGFG